MNKFFVIYKANMSSKNILLKQNIISCHGNKRKLCTCHRLPRGGGGGPWADVRTLLIVHFKVIVFSHPWGLFFLQSPHYLAKPSTQLDLKMHFRTLIWFFEQLANTRTLPSDKHRHAKRARVIFL